jgi:ABC-type Fe3+/spermidine/putrescine transport system ATPase subunit
VLDDAVDVVGLRAIVEVLQERLVAAELIGNPGLFFLDEPTSGLDPGLTRKVTGIIRALAAGGSTVVIISHDVESLQAADRIVFLAAGGHVVFIGTPAEALTYFEVTDFADLYPLVESRDAASWEAQFRASQQYQTRVAPTLARGDAHEDEENPSIDWDPFALIGAGVRRGASAWRQLRLTTSRYLESMLADRTYSEYCSCRRLSWLSCWHSSLSTATSLHRLLQPPRRQLHSASRRPNWRRRCR